MGVENMSMNVYCKSGGGQKQACVFVWKVPTIHSSTHSGKVSATMDTCQEQAPEVIGVEIVNHFNNIMAQISDIPTSVRDTLWDYLFLGQVTPNVKVGDSYCQLILDLALGMPIDESLLFHDVQESNYRGGKGVDATKFEVFWDECCNILLPSSATNERKLDDIVRVSVLQSLPDFVRQVKDSLKQKVEKGGLKKCHLSPPLSSSDFSLYPMLQLPRLLVLGVTK